jgi:hypothetical protein
MSKNKQAVESMLAWTAKNRPVASLVTTSLKPDQLREIGAQHFNGKWTYQIKHGDAWKTYELVPRA